MTDLSVWEPYYSEAEAPGFSQIVPPTSGAGMTGNVAVVEATLSGASVSIPTGAFADAFGLAVHLTVLEEVTGATGIDLGTSSATTLFGTNVQALEAGATAWCRSYTPIEFLYTDDIPVVLTANGGSFTGGKVRLAAYSLGLTPPTS